MEPPSVPPLLQLLPFRFLGPRRFTALLRGIIPLGTLYREPAMERLHLGVADRLEMSPEAEATAGPIELNGVLLLLKTQLLGVGEDGDLDLWNPGGLNGAPSNELNGVHGLLLLGLLDQGGDGLLADLLGNGHRVFLGNRCCAWQRWKDSLK